MKTHHMIILLLVILLGFGACREITVTTTIHHDGSFTREILIEGDSSSVFNMDLPYPVDDSWEAGLVVKENLTSYQSLFPEWSIAQDTSLEKECLLTYRKTYTDMALLNREMDEDTGWRQGLDRDIKIDKHSGIFYTYFTFRESTPSANPFQNKDIHDYLSASEIQMLKEAKPADKKGDSLYGIAEEKAFEYLKETIYNEVTYAMEKDISKLGNPELNAVDLDDYSDSADRKLEDVSFDQLSEFIDFYAEWTGKQEFLLLKTMEDNSFAQLDSKWGYFLKLLEMEGYTQQVVMPGLLIETNSKQVVGNLVSWKEEGFPMILFDHEIFAESRTVNYTGFIISGIILLALVFLLSYSAFRSKGN
ncbi:MAG: hypothetical protein P8100_13235 [bacterium]|jgi:hypothetical protein